MNQPEWETKRTPETKKLEKTLGKHFEKVEAYRFNPASIRVRIVDPRFEGKSPIEREDMVFPVLEELSRKTAEDILMLVLMAPGEEKARDNQAIINLDFEHPSRIIP
jgi:stress-induced morphogen